MDTGLIGHRLTVHEHRPRLRIFEGHKLVQEHDKLPDGAGERRTLPQHRHRRKWDPGPPLPEEVTLRAVSPQVAALVEALRKRHGGRAVKAVRRLHRNYLDYPTQAVDDAVDRALEFGLIDLERIEKMVLARVASDFFHPPTPPESDHG